MRLSCTAVLFAALVLVLAGCASSARPARTSQPSPSNEVATRNHLAQLIAIVPVLPGAVSSPAAPDSALTQAFQEPVSPNLVALTRWWTAPGSAAEAINYFDSHPPMGLTVSGHAQVNGATFAVTGVTFDDATPAAEYDQAQLVVTVAERDGHVDVRADAQAIWLPSRGADDMITGTVTSIDVTIDRRGRLPTVDRTLSGADAQSLVTTINALRVVSPGTRHCPADMGGEDRLVVHTTSRNINVVVAASGCGFVQVGSGPTALYGTNVNHELVSLLGLPASYGS
jgi:hypothetical protein